MDIGREEIDRWHKDRGWRGIGYHYVIRRNGMVEIGRPLDEKGAHVTGHNHHTLGICLVGGIDSDGEPEENFTAEQYQSLEVLLIALVMHYGNPDVRGHRDFQGVSKACPSFDVRTWWADVRRNFISDALGL
jgi:N-acetylmuramoyl-L-alanine amidase